MIKSLLLVFFLCLQIAAVHAELSPEEVIRATITRTFPDIEITNIKKSPVTGLYEVLLGPDLLYATADGRYLLQGDLIDMKQKRNLSEEQRSHIRENLLGSISADEYIEFSPVERKHTVYVFTDVDCAFCRKLHRDMPELNKLGIAVRYLAFPRAGIDSMTYKQMESVWCAVDRNKAMNEAKQGMKVSKKACANPVARQYVLGQDIGVRGTPAIFSEQGQSISGYIPPDKLLQVLTAQ